MTVRSKFALHGFLLAVAFGFGFFIARSFYAVPTLVSLQDRMGEAYKVEEIPRSDIVLALWHNLNTLESGRPTPEAFAGAINYYSMLGCTTNAEFLLRQARADNLSNDQVESIARAWHLH
jgi:hypothetical protein